LTAAHAELTKSQEIVSHAAKAFKDAERLIAFNEFAAVVKGLERKFLEAVVELHKLGPERNSGSSWKTFTPSKELADLVGLQVVPILR